MKNILSTLRIASR